MTTPYERTRAILHTREFLEELQSVQKSPDLPDTLRRRAKALARHYPESWHVHQMHAHMPAFFDPPDSVSGDP
ncbi:BPSL0761 family protein [Variovorax sp. J22R115]|uniref:BPSL0761 family protein n=1 Tax=Variovorax sp. J22R115 TaxID=3053509 RepID=UPI002576EAF2|nr:BPSL0761 family protein [Variovorax sp. J22R115]MDM0053818.1 BPSL0761 family protein [Variovorax sp. J22R115]